MRSVFVIGVGREQDCRNFAACFDEILIEFYPSHRRHMNVGDKAGRLRKTWRCEEIGGRGERLDSKTHRPHESSHGFAKQLIIVNDRNKWFFHQPASGSSLELSVGSPLPC